MAFELRASGLLPHPCSGCESGHTRRPVMEGLCAGTAAQPWARGVAAQSPALPRTDRASEEDSALASGWPAAPECFLALEDPGGGLGALPVMAEESPGLHRPLCPKVLPQWVATKLLVVSSSDSLLLCDFRLVACLFSASVFLYGQRV